MSSAPAQQPQLYYPGLNGVRFFAVLLVLIGHFWTYAFHFSQQSGPLIRCFASTALYDHFGAVGVTIFFTLSGFLITSLLLKEKASAERVAIGKFYLRRILRIWPLYFLYLAVCFFVFPHLGPFSNPVGEGDTETFFWERLTLYSTLLPNVAFVFLPLMPYAFVLWSVGVEEQFYLFWPHLLQRVGSGRLLKWMVGILLVLIAIKVAVVAGNHYQADALHDWVVLADRTRFGCMVIGGMAALLLHRQSALLKWVFAIKTQAMALVSLLLLTVLCEPFSVPVIHQELVAVFTALLLLNLSSNPKSIVKLENRIFRWLGRISYSMYIWHLPVMVGYLLWVGGDPLGRPLLHFPLVLLLVVAAASVSYLAIERPFLRLKRSKSVVLSGDDAQKS
jgi:peptidoglycan/LPS O-acetylase OafA/YrhL